MENSATTARVAAVAGGTSGLGLVVARQLSLDSLHVAVCGRGPVAAASADEQLGEAGSAAVADVRDPRALREWMTCVSRQFGHLDVVVANVGGNSDPSDWAEVLAENVTWVADLVGWVGDLMRPGGAIVMMSSIAARLPQLDAGQAAYGAAKAALEHLTVHSATQLGPLGIRVNAVAPGPVDVSGGFWQSQAVESPEFVRDLRSASALGRFVTADEVASCVAFLASPAASGVTGAVLRCDAGMMGRLP